MNKNEKKFRLVNKTSKNFSIIISNFQYAATLLFRIRDRLRIAFVPSFVSKLVTTINLKRVRLVISQMKLITSITQTINLRRIRLVMVIRERMKFITTITQKTPIIFISSARQKLVTLMKAGILRVIAVPILATFFTLGTYDPQTLGTLDTETLGDMDYTL